MPNKMLLVQLQLVDRPNTFTSEDDAAYFAGAEKGILEPGSPLHRALQSVLRVRRDELASAGVEMVSVRFEDGTAVVAS